MIALDELKDLADRILWRPMDTAPKDGTFILLCCLEDGSRWLASWQGLRWYGVDDMGLTREGHSEGDPEVVTGWAVNAWMPLPELPYTGVGQSPTAPQEGMMRLEFIIAQLRHAYAQLNAGTVRDQKEFAKGLLAPQIESLEQLAITWDREASTQKESTG
jgi:hypothetical protein